jgi:hypothetical protein
MERMEWLDDYKDIIMCLYNQGMKQIEIAEEFEVSQTAISTRLRKWKVSNPDGNRFKRVDISKEELYDMYWNREMHPVDIGKIFGCSKMAIHQKMEAYGIPKRTKSEARRGKLNPIYGIGHTKEARRKMSLAFENGRKIGFNGYWGNFDICDTPNQGVVKMRSGWEIKTAKYLTSKNINWYYEYKWLDLGHAKYLPDFYLPDYDIFIEVKGRKKKIDVVKARSAKKLGYKILLWDGEELLKRGIIDNAGDTEINRKYKNYYDTRQGKEDLT